MLDYKWAIFGPPRRGHPDVAKASSNRQMEADGSGLDFR